MLTSPVWKVLATDHWPCSVSVMTKERWRQPALRLQELFTHLSIQLTVGHMTDTSFLFSSPITSNEPMQTVLSKRCYLWLWNHSYVSHSEYNFGVQPFSNLSVYWNAMLLSVLAAGPGDSSGSQLLSNSLNLLSVASNLKNAQTLLSTLQKNLPPNANLPANIKSLAARVLRAQGECVSATELNRV